MRGLTDEEADILREESDSSPPSPSDDAHQVTDHERRIYARLTARGLLHLFEDMKTARYQSWLAVLSGGQDNG